MRFSVKQLLGGVVVVLCLLSQVQVLAAETVELVEYMRRLQYFTHKAGLALQAKNKPLTDFYLHELEEILDKLQDVKAYDGYPISKLAKQLLEPALGRLEKRVESRQLSQAQADYDALLRACNTCHQATKHGYIKIEKRLDNPFLQSFSPATHSSGK
jgi:hypothetical protein